MMYLISSMWGILLLHARSNKYNTDIAFVSTILSQHTQDSRVATSAIGMNSEKLDNGAKLRIRNTHTFGHSNEK